MANRKVLINRHTSSSGAPVADQMFHGEIAVAHATGQETLWTKNNANEMVPFISCAQTIAIIESKVEAADKSYDVKIKNGETHLQVEPSTNGSATTFTLNTKDVMSLSAFNAYSASVHESLTGITDLLDGVIDSAITEISGDTIIVAQKVNETTGFNSYNLTHRTGHETSGFKKLTTDAYGHVTASTDVAASDIEALGFKDSAWTEEKIASAITGLDSESAVTAPGKYMTGIAIADGKISGITEADIPTLSIESAGTGNVVSRITVSDHKITYETASVATSEGIAELSASVVTNKTNIETLSGATEAISGFAATQIAALSAGTLQLSADTDAAINALSGDVVEYVKVVSGNIETVINTLSGAVKTNETNITNLSAATTALSQNLTNLSAVTLTGVSLNDTPLAVSNHIVSVPVTTSGSGIANATNSGSVADALAVKEYVQNTVSSAVEYKGATNNVPTGTPVKGDLWIASSAFTVDGQNVEIGDFIIYDGTQWQVIEKNLDGAITGNLTQDTVTLGDSTNSVKSLTNGAQGTVLTIGTAGTPVWANDPELTVVSAGTGNVISDITVSDHEITFTKGVKAATDADLQTLSGMVETISGYTNAKFTALSAGTIQLSADTKAAIAELSAGTIHLSADTKATFDQLSAGTIAVYNSATSYADDAIAAAIEALDSSGHTSDTGHYLTSVTITDGKISAIGEAAVPAAVAITATTATPVDTASAVLTGVTASGDDNHELTFGMSNKIFSAVTSDSAITAVSAQTSVNAVSAQTSVSAQTTVSANMAYELSSAATITSGQVTDIVAGIENTKVHEAESADTADKVANALSVSGYATSESSALDTAIAYDGSQAKSLTFGTNGNAGLKSMSMTSAGVVDVEVIDCGTY